MKFQAIHSQDMKFLLKVRAAFESAEDGPKKEAARQHLEAAQMAELCMNQAAWLLAIARAAEALD